MTTTFLLTLLRTTLVLTLCGGVCFLALRKIENRLPKLSRLLWLAVLLTGWFWLQPVIEIPVAETADGRPQTAAEEQSRNLQIAEERPARAQDLAQGKRYSAPPWDSETPPNIQPPREGQENHAGDGDILLPLQGGIDVMVSDDTGRCPGLGLMPLAGRDGTCRLLSYIWLGGMLLTVLLATSGYIRILWSLRKAELADDTLATPWKNLLKEHRIDSRTIPMVISQKLGPALVRMPLGYRLVVPSELWSELSASGRQGILKHELAHFRRRDVWKSFFVRILTLPHWFNPVAHFAANRFDELAEQLCDREAFAGKREGISEFADVLLLMHENAPTHFVVRQSLFGRNLKRRVASLLAETPLERITVMKKTLLVVGMVAILCVALFRVEFVAQEAPNASRERNAVERPDGEHSPPVEGWRFAQQNDGVVIPLYGGAGVVHDARETTPPLRGTPPKEGNCNRTLLVQGRTFEQWQELLQTELEELEKE